MATKTLGNYDGLILGYYPLRAKVQVCRLLCQYLHLPYRDLLFTPQTWEDFKSTQKLSWNYQELPFLKDKELVVTQTYPIVLYILHKAGRKDLLGTSIRDMAKVDMFIWETELMCQVLSVLKNCANMTEQYRVQKFLSHWQGTLRDKFIKLQSEVTNTSYLNYLTVVDFYIYDIFYFFEVAQLNVQINYIAEFPKLFDIYRRVAAIPEIQTYEKSSKAIKNVCPTQFCKQWKSKCMKEEAKGC